jgi:hypothetical protein
VQQSLAFHVQVITALQEEAPVLVTVVRTVMVTFVPQQASTAVGGSNDQFEPHWTVLLVEQVMTGGVVSTILTISMHVAVFEQQSMACQVIVSV